MRLNLIAAILVHSAINAAIVFPRSVLDGPCTGENGAIGVCVPAASCDRDNGTYIHNACPGTSDDIKCCTKAICQLQSSSGDCRWVDECTNGKSLIQNLCPGPDGYKCCVTNEGNSTSGAIPSTTGNATASTKPSQPQKASSNSEAPISAATVKPKLDLGEKILAKAKEAKGIPYHWAGGSCKGATGGGFDCSGLVSWAICQVTGRDLFSEGLRVTRSMYCANEKRLRYKKVGWTNRRAGDAVFFGGKCDCENNPTSIHHVGLMMDDKYTMWNALKTGTRIRKDNFKNWNEKACPYVIRFE